MTAIRDFDCTNPQDRILLAITMSSDASGSFQELNLTWSIYQTYLYGLVTGLETYDCLDALQECDLLAPEIRRLPTWIPDWHCPLGRFTFSSNGYHASKGRELRYSFGLECCIYQPGSQHSKLILNGFILDAADMVTSFPSIDNNVFSGSDLFEAFSKLPPRVKKHADGSCQPAELLAKVMFAGEWNLGDSLQSLVWDGKSHFDTRLLQILDESRKSRTITPAQQSWLFEVMANRRAGHCAKVAQRRHLFATTNGRLGLGPDTMKCEDIVCILFGGNMPFLLRPIDNNQYELVGACYIPGVMLGEAISLLEAGKFKERMSTLV
jgi:hypothetical protein